jgi:hypothetical protein
MIIRDFSIVKGGAPESLEVASMLPTDMITVSKAEKRRNHLREVTEQEVETDPLNFIPIPFDITSMMPAYMEEYRNAENAQLSIYAFPEALENCIDRIAPGTTYGQANKIGCIMKCALEVWNHHPTIAAAIAVFDYFKQANKDTYTDSELNYINRCWKGSKVEQVTLGGASKRINPMIPKKFCGDISRLSKDCGLEMKGHLAIISIMAVVSREAVMLPDTSVKLRQRVSEFLDNVHTRSRGMKLHLLGFPKRWLKYNAASGFSHR